MTAPPTAPLDRLVAALGDPARYPHPVDDVTVIETHISVVLLAGDYAYKLKKPLDLGFLDFRTLEARRRSCEAELALNRRTAPDLYLAVVPIAGSAAAPELGGAGTPIEYAVQMRRFPQDALLDVLARRGGLLPAHIDALAAVTARFHAAIPRADPAGAFGTPGHVIGPARQNFDQLGTLAVAADVEALTALRDWTEREYVVRGAAFGARLRDGFVRECHGDLHLGNIALLGGAPVPFDCIDFNDDFRWIDVMSEVAFLVMDLADHRLPHHAWRYLNAYLEITGDYAGTAVLRFYLVYRAMVRAKIAAIRARQSAAPSAACREYLDLALRYAQSARPALIVMHGLSGSGKTTAAGALAAALGAIRTRSDVERKRLLGLAAADRTRSAPDAGAYAAAVNAQTYDRLAELAQAGLAGGWPVIVDAAFLRRADRDAFRALAARARVPFAIAACAAPEAALRARIAARGRSGGDASEADVAVLERQLATAEPLAAGEAAATIAVEHAPDGGIAAACIDALAARLGMPR